MNVTLQSVRPHGSNKDMVTLEKYNRNLINEDDKTDKQETVEKR